MGLLGRGSSLSTGGMKEHSTCGELELDWHGGKWVVAGEIDGR